ncbi:MAG: ABC transporter permease [Desulfurococcales archaeon]|nr:ABC transporter permease [Desulfurococcales archaeon]
MASMSQYLFKRFIFLIITLIGASFIVFMIIHLLPGDPARILAGPEATEQEVEMIRRQLGLDKPLLIQYIDFMERIVRGDFGRSIITGKPVGELIRYRFINTLKLALVGITISSIIGIPLGVVAALNRNKWIDQAVMGFAILGVSTPIFVIAIFLMLVFTVKYHIFPATSVTGEITFKHLILPGIALALYGAAPIARMTRATTLEVLGQEHVTVARAFGLPERLVIYKYTLRNALIPVVTVIGLIFGYLLAGAVITETVFAYPGLGRLLIDAIFSRDYPLVQIGILFVAATFAIVNTIVDILYMLIDPRIRISGGR